MEIYDNKIEHVRKAIGDTIELAKYMSGKIRNSRVIILNSDELQSIGFSFSKEDIIVIPDGIKHIHQFVQFQTAIKELVSKVTKVILSDDLSNFKDESHLKTILDSSTLPVEFCCFANRYVECDEIITILSEKKPTLNFHSPESFRIIAILAVYNEEDVIVPVVKNLYESGIQVYIIDNWSTDSTFELAHQMFITGQLVGLEKWPPEGPSRTFDHAVILRRKEKLFQELDADWCIHHDADEYYAAPWEGISLRDAIYWVDQQGYNAINHTVLTFSPVDNNYEPGTSFVDYFRYFSYSEETENIRQITVWKKQNNRVNLRRYGGHDVDFPERNVFYYNFSLSHYPIRSQAHGEKKVFIDRHNRWNQNELRIGWHHHYDGVYQGINFIREPNSSIEFNNKYYSTSLLERLSGIGLFENYTEPEPSINHESIFLDGIHKGIENKEISRLPDFQNDKSKQKLSERFLHIVGRGIVILKYDGIKEILVRLKNKYLAWWFTR